VTIPALLNAGADEAAAILAPGRGPLSFKDLRGHVMETARALRQAGIGRTDRLAMVLPNGPEMATAFMAAASAAIAAPLNPGYTAAEFDFFLGDLGPRAVIVEAGRESPVLEVARRRNIPIIELSPLADAAAGLFVLTGLDESDPVALVEPAAEDCALLLHTSGTTARPKLVALTHRQLCASARNVAATLQLTAADRGLQVMPLFHIHGLVAGLLAPLLAGGGVYCTPGMDIGAFADWLSDAGPTWLTAVPTMHQAILDWGRRHPDQAKAASLRLLRSCSAALAPSIAVGLEEVFRAPVLEAYAMTEAAHQMTANPPPPGMRRSGSVGRAAGPDVTILDAAGAELGPDETGEVAIRGENVFAGYVANPQANADAFANGWFRTGDLGALDQDGYLWLKGRLKEMINRGGEKISPIEIENLLLAHPAVAQAVVFSVPHPSLGEEVGAAVVLLEGRQVSVRDLQACLLEQVSLAKVPRRIVFTTALPKGPTGKLRRIGVAEVFGLGYANPRPTFVAPRAPSERMVAEIWTKVLAIADIGLDDDFFELGGDSLSAMRIAVEIHKAMGVDLTLSQLLSHPTVAEFARAVTDARLQALDPARLADLLAEVEGAQGQRV
jgi:acyl-CoA synthetase (AMP-forming)/AMP-acid ligase II/acyl carrier protein